MTRDPGALFATILLLLPMVYFLFASLTFFLARFEDPVVTWMLRGLFKVYFLALGIGCGLGTLAFLRAGLPQVAAVTGLLAVLALFGRRFALGQVDAALRARDAGDAQAIRRLRRLHVGAVVYNAVQAFAVIGSIPVVFAPFA
jgi:hypothetical protein